MHNLSHGLLTLKVEAKAEHPFSNHMEISFAEELPHESMVSGYSTFENLR